MARFIINLCNNIHKILPTKGIYNVQLILNDKNVPIPFEINTRISTTFCLASYSLHNDPFELAFSEKELANQNKFIEGVRLERFWHNYFFSTSKEKI